MNIGKEDPREVEFEDPAATPAPAEPAVAPAAPLAVPEPEPVGV